MSIVYPWNPFQDQLDCRITEETIKTPGSSDRREFVPRHAPFFARDFILKKKGSTTPLVVGSDYVFAHSFDRFIADKNRNVFGSVVLLKDFTSDELVGDYDTIGSPFTLDIVTYGELVTNILTAPRYASWENLLPESVPEAWPSDPHEHPISETYDYTDMMVALKSLVLAVLDKDPTNNLDTRTLLQEHINSELALAHAIDKETLGIDKVPNVAMAEVDDLNGNNANNIVNVNILKEAFRRFLAGTLHL